MSFPSYWFIDANGVKQQAFSLPSNWPGWDGALSTPLTATVSSTPANPLGPFEPDLTRPIWLTLNATSSASGTAQLLRSTDGGTTKLAITKNSLPIGEYSFGGQSGVIVNEAVITETDAAATYYLSITLTAGTVTVRVAQ